MIRPFFKFKNKKSTDFGIDIVQLPDRIKPEKVVETIEIPGRSGTLHIENDMYKSYTISIPCYINSFSRKLQNIDNIISWLDGSGELIISQESDKIYDATIINSIPFSQVLGVFPEFLINFEVQPFKKKINYKNDKIILTKPTTLVNNTNVFSLPKITIFGNGRVTFKINDDDFVISNVDSYVTIDSYFQEVYKNNENKNNTYNSFIFPKFKIGQNVFSFLGDIEKIEIEPNWRYI